MTHLGHAGNKQILVFVHSRKETAKTAWGVNLPAYCVIIKGTQGMTHHMTNHYD